LNKQLAKFSGLYGINSRWFGRKIVPFMGVNVGWSKFFLRVNWPLIGQGESLLVVIFSSDAQIFFAKLPQSLKKFYSSFHALKSLTLVDHFIPSDGQDLARQIK
jgi:hypothetical protein